MNLYVIRDRNSSISWNNIWIAYEHWHNKTHNDIPLNKKAVKSVINSFFCKKDMSLRSLNGQRGWSFWELDYENN